MLDELDVKISPTHNTCLLSMKLEPAAGYLSLALGLQTAGKN